ncbi:hypothetical protein L6452_19414 [Arctium lappa]|uniref:Uncharacterized protein n=1 Tax=Arctium lappa TaxID=4217 RepID=A0ACB9B9D7_ARCLA|nr:hypothetical protein L6452_19414 [Arctium lappa]
MVPVDIFEFSVHQGVKYPMASLMKDGIGETRQGCRLLKPDQYVVQRVGNNEVTCEVQIDGDGEEIGLVICLGMLGAAVWRLSRCFLVTRGVSCNQRFVCVQVRSTIENSVAIVWYNDTALGIRSGTGWRLHPVMSFCKSR